MKTKHIKLKVLLGLLFLSQLLFAQTWNLVWQDEFNYTGLPDANKWGYDTGNGGWGNNELQNYTANRSENARVENGNLIIEARRDWYNGTEYSSARMVTRNKGDWKYGRIEVKAKVPLGAGMWPAIWMLPTDWVYGGWPASGEIDIMENFAAFGIEPNTCHGNIHTQAYHHSIGTNKGDKINGLSNVQDNYHVYAVNWYNNKLEFEVDGVIYFTFINEGTWQTWPFDQRFHLILNIAVGGTLGGSPDPNIFPKRMTVDYVRAYELTSSVPSSTYLATVYDDCSYAGFSGGLDVGDYKLADLQAKGIKNDVISSVKVTEGYKVILYENDNFTGTSVELTANSSCVNNFNDKATSIKVLCNGDKTKAGRYFIENRNSGLYMDVAGGPPATGDGINVFQYTFNGMSNQEFVFTHLGDGVYQILAAHSGKSLDVDNFGTQNGANVHQWTYYGTSNQQFILFPVSGGYYKLIAKNSGKVLEVAGAGKNAMDNVQIYDNNNQTCGQWKLVSPIVTGSSDLNANEIRVFPNPANDQIFVSADQEMLSLELFDLDGRLIKVVLGQSSMSLNDLPSSTYFLKIKTAQEVHTEKIVKW